MNNSEYMYVFVREDLSVAQQIVQLGHATYDVGTKHPRSSSPNFVLIGVKNEQKLLELSEWLHTNETDHHMFFEPDVDQHTAIATKPISGSKRDIFRKFKLYGR